MKLPARTINPQKPAIVYVIPVHCCVKKQPPTLARRAYMDQAPLWVADAKRARVWRRDLLLPLRNDRVAARSDLTMLQGVSEFDGSTPEENIVQNMPPSRRGKVPWLSGG